MSQHRNATAIVGAGAFGTALACVLARGGAGKVTLYGRDTAQMDAIAKTGRNDKSLPGVELPGAVEPTASRDALAYADRILLAVPAQAQREALESLKPHLSPSSELVICAKGIERQSARFLSNVVAEAMPGHAVSVLSGPGFAADIAGGLPTAMTLANAEMAAAEATAAALSSESFRLYASDDVTGVEIGGALKNVLAIAAGIVEGAALGQSARAALIARGLAELTRFALAHGARAETVSGLSGLGDLVLTATSSQSRNFRYGVALGKGASARDLARPGEPLSEGAFTAAVAARIAKEKAIEMPITLAVAAVIDGEIDVKEAVSMLMRRPLRSENGR
jgi:glycerol-3-phosphate dehydrogenase (NAD(P)+)